MAAKKRNSASSAKNGTSGTAKKAKDPVRTSPTDDASDDAEKTPSAGTAAAKKKAAEREQAEAKREQAKDAAPSARRPAADEGSRGTRSHSVAERPSPNWLAPTAVVLLIVGVLYLVTYYLSQGTIPLPIGDWNLLVGFAVMSGGGIMLMFWK